MRTDNDYTIISNNVCFIKIRSKNSSNTLVSLLQIFMKQTLQSLLEEKGHGHVIPRCRPKASIQTKIIKN